MFGKRSSDPQAPKRIAQPAAAPAAARAAEAGKVQTAAPAAAAPRPEPEAQPQRRHSEEYYDVKTTVFNALIDTIDLTQLAKLDAAAAREEIRDIVSEIIQIKNVVMSIAEQEELLEDICNDVLGYGPLEPLLARDDIADIMVNGANTTYIEVGGKVQRTGVRFADNTQLMNICQRIVSQVGRRVDEASPICDARLPDGSRVNVIAPPLAIDGPTLTIRKFKKEKLKVMDLVRFGAFTEEMAAYLEACLEEAGSDAAFIAKALGDIARAKGMSQVARDAGLSRESLYKALSENGDPSFATVLKVARALGVRLHAEAA